MKTDGIGCLQMLRRLPGANAATQIGIAYIEHGCWRAYYGCRTCIRNDPAEAAATLVAELGKEELVRLAPHARDVELRIGGGKWCIGDSPRCSADTIPELARKLPDTAESVASGNIFDFAESCSMCSDCHELHVTIGDDFGIPAFNDTHTHAEVLALFDRTIARMEATK